MIFLPHFSTRLSRAARSLGLSFAVTASALLAAAAAPSSVSATKLGDLSAAQPPSTQKMIERLNELWANSNPIENFYLNTEAAELSRMMLMRGTGGPDFRQIQLMLQFMLQAGATEAALQDLERFEKLFADAGVPFPPDVVHQFTQFKALGYLRLGEQENCLHHHNGDSCVFPIKGGGVHQLPRGSRKAVEFYTQMLQQDPKNLQSRWLLNIAYMTLGEFPDGVPAEWRMPAESFESDYDIKRFPDVAGALGLAIDDLSGGVVMEDFDRDGLLDLVVSGSGPRSQLRVFRNNGDGTFADRTAAAGVTGVTGGLNMIHADYDNDGFPDVLVLRTGWLRQQGKHPNSLLRNNGDFTFTDVTEQAGLLSFSPTQAAVWFDYNADGWLDLFIGNESLPGEEPHPCELYRNNRDGTFTECAEVQGLKIVGYVKGVTAGDFNNDGRPDLYLSLLRSNNRLFRNDGPATSSGQPESAWSFSDVAPAAGVTDPQVSFPCWFFDYDNDGWEDLMVMGYFIKDSGDIAADYLGLPHTAERPRLYRNNRDGTFTDVGLSSGLGTILHTMGCNFGDLDNDGWLDFYAGTGDPNYTTLIPNRMFRNDGSGKFQDVTTSGGFGQLQKGHAIAFGDLDNDGDQDIYSVIGGVFAGDHYPNQLFANPGHGHRWLKLELEGVKSNRDAVGARIKVIVKTREGKERELHRTVGFGSSFGSSAMRQEIGLGTASAITRVEVLWPSTGKKQVFTNLAPDRFYRIREGVNKATEVRAPSFVLPAAGAAATHQHH